MMSALDHNKTLGVLFLIFGGVNILLLIPITLQATKELKRFEEIASVNPNPEPIYNAAGFLTILLIALGILSLLSSLLEIVAGYGMFKNKTWARSAATIAAIMALIVFPVGTALGIYALWFVTGKTGQEFYGKQFLNG